MIFTVQDRLTSRRTRLLNKIAKIFFKEKGLEKFSLILVRSTGCILDWEVSNLIRKADTNRLNGYDVLPYNSVACLDIFGSFGWLVSGLWVTDLIDLIVCLSLDCGIWIGLLTSNTWLAMHTQGHAFLCDVNIFHESNYVSCKMTPALISIYSSLYYLTCFMCVYIDHLLLQWCTATYLGNGLPNWFSLILHVSGAKGKLRGEQIGQH